VRWRLVGSGPGVSQGSGVRPISTCRSPILLDPARAGRMRVLIVEVVARRSESLRVRRSLRSYKARPRRSKAGDEPPAVTRSAIWTTYGDSLHPSVLRGMATGDGGWTETRARRLGHHGVNGLIGSTCLAVLFVAIAVRGVQRFEEW